MRRLRHLLSHLQWKWGFDCPICYAAIELAFYAVGDYYQRDWERYKAFERAITAGRVETVSARSMRIPLRLP